MYRYVKEPIYKKRFHVNIIIGCRGLTKSYGNPVLQRSASNCKTTNILHDGGLSVASKSNYKRSINVYMSKVVSEIVNSVISQSRLYVKKILIVLKPKRIESTYIKRFKIDSYWLNYSIYYYNYTYLLMGQTTNIFRRLISRVNSIRTNFIHRTYILILWLFDNK